MPPPTRTRTIAAELRVDRPAGTDRETEPISIDARRTEDVEYAIEMDSAQSRDVSRRLSAFIYVEVRSGVWEQIAAFTWHGKSRSVNDPDPNPTVWLPADEIKGRRTRMRIVNHTQLEYAEEIV